jgi:predicted ATPase
MADVEGSTQLWHSRPEEMTAAIANLDPTLADLMSTHHGVRPVEQGGGGSDGAWYVDLAPITDPDLVPIIVARTLGLPDQPGRSPENSLLQFVGGQHMLMLLDNCEHLLDASATLTTTLLGGCPGLTLLATSREPIGVAGEARADPSHPRLRQTRAHVAHAIGSRSSPPRLTFTLSGSAAPRCYLHHTCGPK